MEEGRKGLSKKLRDEVSSSPAPEMSANALVRLCLINSGTPSNDFLKAQDAKYGLPTMRALDVLLLAHAQKPVAW